MFVLELIVPKLIQLCTRVLFYTTYSLYFQNINTWHTQKSFHHGRISTCLTNN